MKCIDALNRKFLTWEHDIVPLCTEENGVNSGWQNYRIYARIPILENLGKSLYYFSNILL